MNQLRPIVLGTMLLLIFSAVATAQAEPCKECFWGLCQNTPTGVPGKDNCSNLPKVELNCTIGLPGGVVCGVTITPQCQSSGAGCMNWMEFIWVSGAMESPECDDGSPAGITPSLRKSPLVIMDRASG